MNSPPDQTPPPDKDVAIALGQVTVALRSVVATISEIQAEMWRRMQSPGMHEIMNSTNKLGKEVDEAWKTVQSIFERASQK